MEKKSAYPLDYSGCTPGVFHEKLVAGVGFESRSRSCGIMSLHKLLEAKSTFLTF
jgi:hypothetical protein